ncbi:MAG: MOSC N-terminal beta barrel domain-containing protein [Planctomycetota bacterium]|nr:MOSC N-terminal beta barrel domain-containing protein [Planctomycetota bacterium]
MSFLAGISVYPIKSFDALFGTEILVGPQGRLLHDRAYALFDAEGKYVNGKRNAKVHRLRAKFDPHAAKVTLNLQGAAASQTFHLEKDREKLEAYLAKHFGFVVTLKRDPEKGFPDDPEAWGPTILSTGTMKEVASWYPGVKPDDVWKRFRPNLVIGGVEAFWEDRLYRAEGKTVSFKIGKVAFEGVNPCRRCVVPTRDALTGEPFPDFTKIFLEKRKSKLPAWAEPTRFADTYYRLAVNTRIPASEAGKEMQIGDKVVID